MHLFDNGLGRIRHDFRQCRVVVRDAQEILSRATEIHDGEKLVNEFGRVRSNDFRSHQGSDALTNLTTLCAWHHEESYTIQL